MCVKVNHSCLFDLGVGVRVCGVSGVRWLPKLWPVRSWRYRSKFCKFLNLKMTPRPLSLKCPEQKAQVIVALSNMCSIINRPINQGFSSAVSSRWFLRHVGTCVCSFNWTSFRIFVFSIFSDQIPFLTVILWVFHVFSFSFFSIIGLLLRISYFHNHYVLHFSFNPLILITGSASDFDFRASHLQIPS